MAKLHVAGDPEKLVDTVLEEAKREVESKVEEAYRAARELVEEAYREAVKEVEKAIRSEVAEFSERLKALEASKEVELRMVQSRIKSEYTEKVIREALKRASSVVPGQRYRAFLEKRLREALESMKKYSGEARIIPCAQDRRVVEEIAAKTTVDGIAFVVSTSDLEECSGFIVESGDGRVRLDYRLETLLAPYMDELRAIALRNLFPS